MSEPQEMTRDELFSHIVYLSKLVDKLEKEVEQVTEERDEALNQLESALKGDFK